MVATLTFDLSDPDQAAEHRRCCAATDVYIALRDMERWMRDQIKHGDAERYAGIEAMRDEFYSILGTHNINLDDLR